MGSGLSLDPGNSGEMKVESRMKVFLKHPNLHCISKLLEHVVDVIKLHGYRSLGQSFDNIWFLCHFLQDLLEVLGHCVVRLKQERLVPLKTM